MWVSDNMSERADKDKEGKLMNLSGLWHSQVVNDSCDSYKNCRIGVVLTAPEDWTAAAFMKSIRDRCAEAIPLDLSRVSVSITDTGLSWLYEAANLYDLDGLIVRDVGMSNSLELISAKFDLIRQFERNMRVMNTSIAIQNAANKFLSLVLFHKAHLPVPRTVVTTRLEVAKRAIADFQSVVLKPMFGSQGKGIIKLEEPDDNKLSALLKERGVLYLQEFIPNPGRDIRVFVVADEAVGAIYRVSPHGSFVSNLSQGGRPRRCELTDELSELAIRATKAIGADFAGVDIIEGSDSLYLLEINATPSGRGIKLACGIDVTVKIVDLLFAQLKR